MTFTIIALLRRRDDITPEQFRTHYETVHVELLRSLVQKEFPLTYVRHYISRPGGGSADAAPLLLKDLDNQSAPTLLQGRPSDITFDVVTVMTWEDEEAHGRFAKIFALDHVAQKINDDEANFLDRDNKLVFTVGKTSTTAPE
ncbi:hypothetical protein INS49_003224 [Diaporthe citri]|uniref:uncharacterized protein n=1 Tax=Diaporthe citri TaxID=83186 RepID=UPI001C8204CC|nr:uncharacterized protein INS49_003224 [Diaporthe citri]KAG6369005.1 hypothetical protein INS49_003224 [Diaporthe citri]